MSKRLEIVVDALSRLVGSHLTCMPLVGSYALLKGESPRYLEQMGEFVRTHREYRSIVFKAAWEGLGVDSSAVYNNRLARHGFMDSSLKEVIGELPEVEF
ncbi:hypothetical protein HOI26_00660 [Candidatus Woesearchaeota archaeon]|nr:hypothetical protein [Candidatus Woesearchaeota archaeon]MBT5739585.1 hypothetical protein [Candidatus Woesearchaeota archaeon]